MHSVSSDLQFLRDLNYGLNAILAKLVYCKRVKKNTGGEIRGKKQSIS